MSREKLIAYLQIGLFQALIISSSQYIYEEIDKKLGIALLYLPVGLLLSYNIANDSIKEYAVNYALSGIFKALLALLFWISLNNENFTRFQAYLIVATTFLVSLVLFYIYAEI
tara:strand:- start:1169 stop:1507 length:339 start_codon:yes stop_codon:yes gene_type:complete